MSCPRGHGAMDAWRAGGEAGAVDIDVCKTCRGIWLDANEGRALRRVLSSSLAERERRKFTPSVLSYVFQLVTSFPIEEWNPVRRRPLTIICLFWIILGAYVLRLVLIDNPPADEAAVWVRSLFLIPDRFLAGEEHWTLLTHLFMHASILHLVGNLWFHWVFGDNVEDTLGSGKTLMLWLLAGVAGSLSHVVAHPESRVPLVGASGAIAGLMGAYVVLFPRVKVWVVLLFFPLRIPAFAYLAVWIGLQLWGIAQGTEMIAWYAHLVGFATGVVFALLVKRSVPQRKLLQKISESALPHWKRRQPWNKPSRTASRYTSRASRSRTEEPD